MHCSQCSRLLLAALAASPASAAALPCLSHDIGSAAANRRPDSGQGRRHSAPCVAVALVGSSG